MDTAARFEQLQRERLETAWRADLPGSTTPHVLVGLPSYSVDRNVYEHYGDRVGPLEHRYLYVILRACNPGTRVVYLSSCPVPDEVVAGYLSLAAPEQRDIILGNTLLASPADRSPRPLAEKVLDAPQLLDQIAEFIGGEPALLEPWNVTAAERDLAVTLDVPINGTGPDLRGLATKSNGRELFRAAGVPVPAGVEHVTSSAQVVDAIRALWSSGAARDGVVVKLDDSVAGDGNIVLRFDDGDDLEARVAAALPAWYVEVLRSGGVVEELVTGADFCSPSGQGDLRPDGTVQVFATHDQRLGGADHQVYEGCSFPARAEYAPEIARHVEAVGRALFERGARGRFAVDFAAVRGDAGWRLSALEINLRKGGTTHTFGITRLMTGGSYDAARGRFVLADGSERFYGATDNLVHDSWSSRTAYDVRARLANAGVAYDGGTRSGVIPHLLDCLPIDGRMGYTAIGRTRDEVADLEARIAAALA